jgi:hypothetical protein
VSVLLVSLPHGTMCRTTPLANFRTSRLETLKLEFFMVQE